MKRKKKYAWFTITIIAFLICFYVKVKPAKAATVGNSTGNLMQSGTACYYKGWIYYTCQNKLYKIKENGTKKTKIFADSNTGEGHAITSINIYKDKIYMALDEYASTAYSNTYIYSMNLKGKDRRLLASGANLVVMNGWIYYIGIRKDNADGFWADSGYKGIYRMSLDGTKNKKIKSIGRWDAKSLSGDGEYLYYQGDNKVLVLDKNGKTMAQKKKASLIGTVKNKLFYLDEKKGAVYCSNRKFKNVKKIVKVSKFSLDEYEWSANVDSKYLYLCNHKSKKLIRVEYNKKKQKNIVSYKKAVEYGDLYLVGTRIIQDYTMNNGAANGYFLDLRKKDGKFIKRIGKYSSL